jgi:cell division protein FtsB
MKRMIAGVLLMVGLGAGTMFAEDGWRDRRDIRRDEARIAHDRREFRRDLYHGKYAAARHERRDLRREYRDLNRDRRDWR